VDPVMEVPKDGDGLLAVFHPFSWCRLGPAGIQRLPFPEPADLAVRPDGVDTVCRESTSVHHALHLSAGWAERMLLVLVSKRRRKTLGGPGPGKVRNTAENGPFPLWWSRGPGPRGREADQPPQLRRAEARAVPRRLAGGMGAG